MSGGEVLLRMIISGFEGVRGVVWRLRKYVVGECKIFVHAFSIEFLLL